MPKNTMITRSHTHVQCTYLYTSNVQLHPNTVEDIPT